MFVFLYIYYKNNCSKYTKKQDVLYENKQETLCVVIIAMICSALALLTMKISLFLEAYV